MDGKGMKVSCTLRSRAVRGILVYWYMRSARSGAPWVIKFGYDVTVRPSVHTTVRTFRVGVSRKRTDKSESVN